MEPILWRITHDFSRQAVRKAFEGASGIEWGSIREEYVATRIAQLYNPFDVDDLDAGGVALDLVRRAYLQGLRESAKADAQSRSICAQREAAYTVQLMDMFDSQTDPDWTSPKERTHVESSLRAAFRAGCDEGRLSIGSVI